MPQGATQTARRELSPTVLHGVCVYARVLTQYQLARQDVPISAIVTIFYGDNQRFTDLI